ncbi:MAG: glutamine synthetase family protein [Mangrovibacterium sp.]|nr:glutamine synthetase family protein [Mangrovibacterium sp.]
METSELIKKIEQSGHRKIKYAISDIDGILRAKVVHLDKFMAAVKEGMGFCDVIFGWDANDSCYDNTVFTGWHTGYPDRKASIDLDTFRTIPWENGMPYFLADFSSEASGTVPCPRSLLKKVSAQCDDFGFKAVFSHEFEWFNFVGTPNQHAASDYRELTPLSPGMFGYSQLRPALYQSYYHELFDFLEQFQVPLESFHTETGPGVYEASIAYDEILAAADKAILFKSAVKEIAYRHGVIASFMAKWNENLPGSGGHIHQSLQGNEGGKNLFWPDDPQKPMTALLENYLAGQLKCLPDILPMYAPTINSYKRLRLGAWAPSTVTWGKDNRTAAIRLISSDKRSARLEMRVPGADCNPYLAMAAALASGLYGIRNNLTLTIPESCGNAYEDTRAVRLPASLAEATQAMRKSAIARELFGDSFVEHFVSTREWECREFERTVTEWEVKRYLEII